MDTQAQDIVSPLATLLNATHPGSSLVDQWDITTVGQIYQLGSTPTVGYVNSTSDVDIYYVPTSVGAQGTVSNEHDRWIYIAQNGPAGGGPSSLMSSNQVFIDHEVGQSGGDDPNSNYVGTFNSPSITLTAYYIDNTRPQDNWLIIEANKKSGVKYSIATTPQAAVSALSSASSSELTYPQGTSPPPTPSRLDFSDPQLKLPLFGTNAGNWTSQDLYPRAMADVNGDGLADIVGFGASATYVSLATGGGNFGSTITGVSNFGSDPLFGGGWTSLNQYPRVLADVNGDGKADIVGFGSVGTYVSLATSAGHFGSAFLGLSGYGYDVAAGGGWTSQDLYPRLLADIDGDKQADIVAFGAAGTYVSLATGGGHFAAPILAVSNFGSDPIIGGGWSSQNAYPRALADVNGDGKADIVAFGAAGTYVSEATTGGHFAAPILASDKFGQSAGAGGWSSQDLFPRMLADINADGRADIIGFGSSGAFTALGQTNGTFAAPIFDFGDFGSLPSSGAWTSQNTYPRFVADVTGDHRADLIGFGIPGVFVAASIYP